MTNEKLYKMSFAKIYPLYIAKVEKKGRAKAEVDPTLPHERYQPKVESHAALSCLT